MDKEVLGNLIKEALGEVVRVSDGKSKLQAEVILMDFEQIEMHQSIRDKMTKMPPDILTEEQYGVIKDSYNSIKAEYNKILSVLGGVF